MTVAVAGFILSFLFSTAFGSGFHLFVGGPLRTIPLYLIASWVGFFLGHLVGSFFDIALYQLGAIHLLPAAIGSFAALISCRWFVDPPVPQDQDGE